MLDKNGIAKRIAKEVRDGYYVNLGIGIPTLVANYLPKGINVTLQSENGMLGMGPFPFEGDEDAGGGGYRVGAVTELVPPRYTLSSRT